MGFWLLPNLFKLCSSNWSLRFSCVASVTHFFILGENKMREINERVVKIRKKHGFSQENLADKLNMKLSTYSQMERSGKIPCEVLVEIAEVFKMDIRYFLYDNFEKCAQIEKEPMIIVKDNFMDDEERYIVTTYRNLNINEKDEAYQLFMENFNFDEVIKRRREEKRKRRGKGKI